VLLLVIRPLYSLSIGDWLVMHDYEYVVDEDFKIVNRDLVIMNDVIKNSLRGLSYFLWVRTRLRLRLISGRNIIIISSLREFLFFNTSIAELVDQVIDYRVEMTFFLLLR
jgi:hypothetical protein